MTRRFSLVLSSSKDEPRRSWVDRLTTSGVVLVTLLAAACGSSGPQARNLVLITIDTLRADRVGAYGYARARTPALDALARTGVRFERAYAAAPITLTSHATLLTGRYPPNHGARDNGMAMPAVPTLATELKAKGFRTAAFVAAFPLDHQFGLNRGFDVYSDRLGRDAAGKLANERPGSQVVNEAIAWLRSTNPEPRTSNDASAPYFLWVHLFEPHAPYGNQSAGRPIAERYDEEIATADREVGRLITALGTRPDTLVIATSDHGEAFGEHGEYAHSIFVYDTTLRVPLIVSGPGLPALTVSDPVSLADVAPTAARLLGVALPDAGGLDVAPLFSGRPLPAREIYAESFAPLLQFGWAPLRALRSGSWKYIAAPKPELFDLERDPTEQTNVVSLRQDVAQPLARRMTQFGGDTLASRGSIDPKVTDRLRALGYASGSASQGADGPRPDPKDRRELAARIARVTSGELEGAALLEALEAIVRDDPRNGRAQVQLGYMYLDSGDCTRAEPAFREAAAAGLPSADVYLGLAACMGRRNDLTGAEQALTEAQRLEPDNPAVVANVGVLQSSKGDLPAAIQALQRAVELDPAMLEARFHLSVAFAKAGRRSEAAATARDLLGRLPSDSPQRPEVERLLRAIQ